MEIQLGQTVLDLACGTGFFAREFLKKGAKVVGVDVSEELLQIARKNSDKKIQYVVSSADNLSFLLKNSVDIIVIVLALQNIQNVSSVMQECARVLKPGGRLFVVLNHPAFRGPKASAWGWDEENMVQYRRVDAYLSERQAKIEMHPGENKNIQTVSFHRPLQFYFKIWHKHNLVVSKMEEWISNRIGPKGRKFTASERARKEIPLFMCLEVKKI